MHRHFKTELGFQVFQHMIISSFKSFAFNELIELLMTDWF